MTVNRAFLYQFPDTAFTDTDAGDALTYAAELSDGTALPGWLSFDPTDRTFTGRPTAVGTVRVKVTATDTGALSAHAEFDITVIRNTRPTVANAIPNQSAQVGVPFSYTFPEDTFADADEGDTLTYRARGRVFEEGEYERLAGGKKRPEGWLRFDASTRTISGTPPPGSGGTTTVRITAYDQGELGRQHLLPHRRRRRSGARRQPRPAGHRPPPA